MDEARSATIAMVVFPGMQLLDLIGPLDVFGAVPGAKPILVGATKDRIAFGHGVGIVPMVTYGEFEGADVLFVPGGSGVNALMSDGVTLPFLAATGSSALYVTSVCTGSLALGAAGLLRGYRATTHWNYRDLLAHFGAISSDGRVVRDRNRLTGGGVTAGIDFGLALVSEIWGETMAQSVQLMLEYNPDPPFDAGSPETAPPEILADVRAALSEIYVKRAALAEALGKALTKTNGELH